MMPVSVLHGTVLFVAGVLVAMTGWFDAFAATGWFDVVMAVVLVGSVINAYIVRTWEEYAWVVITAVVVIIRFL
jgi:hypothetical protein